MRAYIGTKIIKAGKIVDVEYQGNSGAILTFDTGERYEASSQYVAKHKPEAGGYFVKYPDGYESFSPGDTFEGAYRVVKINELELLIP